MLLIWKIFKYRRGSWLLHRIALMPLQSPCLVQLVGWVERGNENSRQRHPWVPKPLKEEWISDHTWKLIDERKQLHQRWLNSASTNTTSYQAYMDTDKEIKCIAERDKREWLDYQAEKDEKAAVYNDMRSFYWIAKRISSTVPSRYGLIKTKGEKLLSNREERLTRWAEHLSEMLNQPKPATPAKPERACVYPPNHQWWLHWWESKKSHQDAKK